MLAGRARAVQCAYAPRTTVADTDGALGRPALAVAAQVLVLVAAAEVRLDGERDPRIACVGPETSGTVPRARAPGTVCAATGVPARACSARVAWESSPPDPARVRSTFSQAIVAPAQGFAPLRLRGGGVNTQRTYAMIKPDAVKAGKVDEMQALLKSAGFKIIKQKKVQLSQEQVICVRVARPRRRPKNAMPTCSLRSCWARCQLREAVLACRPIDVLTLLTDSCACLCLCPPCRLRDVPTQAKEFYSEHKARPFFGGLVEFMTRCAYLLY